jgi:hypothetical protein
VLVWSIPAGIYLVLGVLAAVLWLSNERERSRLARQYGEE